MSVFRLFWSVFSLWIYSGPYFWTEYGEILIRISLTQWELKLTSFSSGRTCVVRDTIHASTWYDLICFNRLSSLQGEVPTDKDLQIFERFVIFIYDRSSKCTSISMHRLSVLLELYHWHITVFCCIQSNHFCRAIKGKHQSIFVLPQIFSSNCFFSGSHLLLAKQNEVSRRNWMGLNIYHTASQPVWSTVPPSSQSCRKIFSYKCKKQCSGRCKCFKNGLSWMSRIPRNIRQVDKFTLVIYLLMMNIWAVYILFNFVLDITVICLY